MRRLLLLLWPLACALAASAASPPERFARVEVPVAKTSIYLGSVSLTMPTFVRHDGIYESTYAAKVFPYFFANESGRLVIQVSDAQLGQLEAGQPIDFTGRAVRADGSERRVEGRATPADANGGKLKVRVFVTAKIELIFNTTYRFAAKS
jgi:hypothetical protein